MSLLSFETVDKFAVFLLVHIQVTKVKVKDGSEFGRHFCSEVQTIIFTFLICEIGGFISRLFV